MACPPLQEDNASEGGENKKHSDDKSTLRILSRYDYDRRDMPVVWSWKPNLPENCSEGQLLPPIFFFCTRELQPSKSWASQAGGLRGRVAERLRGWGAGGRKPESSRA